MAMELVFLMEYANVMTVTLDQTAVSAELDILDLAVFQYVDIVEMATVLLMDFANVI